MTLAKWHLSEMNDQSNDKRDDISSEAVQNALSRILRSEEFRDADRLSAFLQYVVDETLAGRSAGIKATTIALDVFDRDLEKDNGSDSIVRVTAARLRRALSHYYSEEGKDDPVLIELKSGSYVPHFVRQPMSEPQRPPIQTNSKFENGKNSRRSITYIAFAALAVIAVMAGYLFSQLESRAPEVTTESRPFVAVLPLVVDTDNNRSQKIANGYLEAVVTNLANLSDISVMAARSSISAARTNTPLESLRQNFGISHVLRGSLATQTDRLRISVQLVETQSGAVVFADRFEGTPGDLFELEDRIANRLTTALSVATDPDEIQRVYLRHTNNDEAIYLIREAANRINPPNEKSRVEASRDLYERIVELDPKFAGGYAGLSQAHSYMVLFDHSLDPKHDLEKAVKFAELAIEVDPGFGNGYAMLGLAHSLSGNADQAIRQARRAVALSPGDPLSHQWLGGTLVFSDRSEDAVEAILEAIRLDPLEPGTPYLNILGMAYFNIEQYENAIDAFEQNILRGGPDAPNMEAYRAATYAELGRESEARGVLARLNVRPGEISPERWIRSWTPSRDKAEGAIQSLYDLGMKSSDNSGSKATD